MDIDTLNAAQSRLETFLRNDQRINAIKEIRTIANTGLREAKAIADAMRNIMGFSDVPAYRSTADYIPVEPNPNDAHYVVCYRSGGEDYVHNFRDDNDNRDQAMDLARDKLQYVSDSANVTVAKVIATTKRTLQVL